MRKNPILQLYKNNKTVFTTREIALVWQENHSARLKNKIKYYLEKGDLISLRRGLYAKVDYNVQEAVVKIYKPAYISFETVLAPAGVIFQYYETIFAASYLTRKIILKNGQKIAYRKLKNEILLNPRGIERKNNLTIATKERAFLDIIYLNSDYYFDNLAPINWDECLKLAKIYKSKKLIETLNFHRKQNAGLGKA
jgi:hypothetical protein